MGEEDTPQEAEVTTEVGEEAAEGRIDQARAIIIITKREVIIIIIIRIIIITIRTRMKLNSCHSTLANNKR